MATSTQAFVLESVPYACDYFVSRQASAMVVASQHGTAAAIASPRQRHPDLIIIGVEIGAIKPAART